MKIRKVRPDEWENLQALNNEVFVDNAKYDPDLVLDWAYSDEGRKYFQELVNDPDSICFVAEDNNKLVGYLAASPKLISYRKSRYLEVDNIGVIPTYRSHGVGKMLMDICKEWARENNYQKLYVNSYFQNEQAIRFYKKNGFNPIDISLELALSD
ncbi:MAG: GNAT family N-acetyltransferase [Candidatus Pacebacteria bacterium]|nr:GNAT family N-acetyltransferase [Candidatus Paceibacterota bacterium]